MEVTKDNKTLYHIQNIYIESDYGVYDLFVYSDHMPNKNDIVKLLKEDFENRIDCEVLAEGCKVYKVYASEIIEGIK